MIDTTCFARGIPRSIPDFGASRSSFLDLPDFFVHRFEKELVVGTIEGDFEVFQRDLVGWLGQFDEVRRLFFVDVVDDLHFFDHFDIFLSSYTHATALATHGLISD